MTFKKKFSNQEILKYVRNYEVEKGDYHLSEQIVNTAANMLGFKIACFYIVEPKTNKLIATGLDGVRTSNLKSYIGRQIPLTTLKPFMAKKLMVGLSFLISSKEDNKWKKAIRTFFPYDKELFIEKSKPRIDMILVSPLSSLNGQLLGVLILGQTRYSKQTTSEAVDLFVNASAWALERGRLVRAQEDRSKAFEEWDRKGLEDDLHDLINWYHSGVVIGIDVLREWLDHNDFQKVKRLIPELQTHARSVIRELRNIHSALISQYMEKTNLRDALLALIQVWSNRSVPKYDKPLSVNLECPTDLELPAELRNKLLRIASSALSNAILHSGVLVKPNIRILIKVKKYKDKVVLSVIDDGIGSEHLVEGYGITRMRELVHQITRDGDTATLYISSEVAKGTKVETRVSLSKEERNA